MNEKAAKYLHISGGVTVSMGKKMRALMAEKDYLVTPGVGNPMQAIIAVSYTHLTLPTILRV